MVFTLKTHRHIYGPPAEDVPAEARTRGLGGPLLTLLAATIGVAFMSELLVRSVTDAARSMGMSQLFVGVIVVALVGNAAEHYSAVTLAAKDKMDAALSIAVGSVVGRYHYAADALAGAVVALAAFFMASVSPAP